MSPEFDPHGLTTPPVELSQLLNKEHTVTGNVWSDFHLTIPKSKMPKKHVRCEHSDTHTKSHLRQTDIGHLYIGLYNIDGAHPYPYGEIFVDYDIVLTGPNQTRSSIKYHQLRSTNISATAPPGSARLPLLGNVYENHEDPSYLPTHSLSETQVEGTLGLKYHKEDNIGLNASSVVDATRFTFSEPFDGVLTTYMGTHSGSMPVSSPIKTTRTDPGFTYTTTTPNLAEVSEISSVTTGGSGASFSNMWKIIAKAGDVIDMYWDGSGTFAFEDVLLTLAEFGAAALL